MKRAALSLALLCGLAGSDVAGAVPVWLPDLQRTAQLTPAGLHLTPGQRLELSYGAEYGVDIGQGRRARFAPTKNLTLEVLDAAGKVTASRVLHSLAGYARLIGTVRGPCVASWYDGTVTICYASDLKSAWAQLGEGTLLVTRGGGAAYERDPGVKGYVPDIPLIRTDLRNKAPEAPVIQKLSVQAALDAGEAEYRRAMFDTYDAVNTVDGLRELPGGRLLACVSMSLPKFSCRLDILNANGKRMLTLNGAAAGRLPQVSRDGKFAYALGNTLQIWNLQTGNRVFSVNDPAWVKARRSPIQAYLTPDGARAVVIAGSSQVPPTPGVTPEGFVYAVNSGKLLQRFIITPP